MRHRVAEATLWGVHEVTEVASGLTVGTATSTLGVSYEIKASSIWASLRLPAALALIPRDAVYRSAPCGPGESEDGVWVIHYWKDTRHHVTTSGGTAPGTQVRQPD